MDEPFEAKQVCDCRFVSRPAQIQARLPRKRMWKGEFEAQAIFSFLLGVHHFWSFHVPFAAASTRNDEVCGGHNSAHKWRKDTHEIWRQTLHWSDRTRSQNQTTKNYEYTTRQVVRGEYCTLSNILSECLALAEIERHRIMRWYDNDHSMSDVRGVSIAYEVKHQKFCFLKRVLMLLRRCRPKSSVVRWWRCEWSTESRDVDLVMKLLSLLVFLSLHIFMQQKLRPNNCTNWYEHRNCRVLIRCASRFGSVVGVLFRPQTKVIPTTKTKLRVDARRLN